MSSEQLSSSPQRFSALIKERFGVCDPSTVLEHGKIVDDQMKLRIRAYLYAADNDLERKKRQEEVVGFFGLKPQQVASLFAWVKYGNRKMNACETEEQRTEILELMGDVHDAFERALLVFEIRELYQLTTDCVEKILEADLEKSEFEPVLEEFQLPVTVTGEEMIVFSAGRSSQSHTENEEMIMVGESFDQEGITGDLVSYQNERKQRWRQRVLDAIVDFTDEEQRRSMKVLTLPGRRCLEIPGLLSIGIRAENIVGVEGGSEEARLEFMKNATRYGIQTRLGRLKKIVPEENIRFGAVLLDFHGQWSASKEFVLSHLLLDERAVVMTNVLAKREGIDIQLNMREIDAQVRHYQEFPIEEQLRKTTEFSLYDLDPRMSDDELADFILGPSQGHLIDEQRKVRELRDAGFSDLLASLLSIDREENWADPALLERLPGLEMLGVKFPNEVDRSEGHTLSMKHHYTVDQFGPYFKRLFAALGFHPTVLRALEEQVMSITAPLFGSLGMYFDTKEVSANVAKRQKNIFDPFLAVLQYMYHRMSMSLPRIIALNKYAYESQSGVGTSTFYTDIVAVESPYRVAEQCRSTMRFLLKGLSLAMIEHFSDPKVYFVIRDKFGKIPHQYASGDLSLAPPSLSSLDTFGSQKKRRRKERIKPSTTLFLKDGYGQVIHEIKMSKILRDLKRFCRYVTEVGMDDDVQKRRRLDPRIEIE